MEKLQIEALEPIKMSREAGGPMETGDRRTFVEPQLIEQATRMVKAGFAKDLTGQIETGERKVIKATITPHDSEVKSNG